MSDDVSSRAAYHGPGWKARTASMADEIREGDIWADFVCDSEWSRLRKVLFYLPGSEIGGVKDVDGSLHLRSIDAAKLERQHNEIVRAYLRAGVGVFPVERGPVDDRRHPNLMFQRDTFWQTPHGAVLARMASPVRAGEEKYTATALAKLHVPIALTVGGTGTFEGADCLWAGPRTVLCGVGVRTNEEGFAQVRDFLARYGIECRAVPMPSRALHLLGCVQIVAPDRALVRTEIADSALVAAVRECGLEVVEVPESAEVVEHLAFNFVVLDRNVVLMAEGVPEFRRFLEGAGVTVAGCVPVSEYVAAAGGVGCATGILARDPTGS